MSKVAFGADIHFGVSGRLDDILFACRVMVEYCVRTNIDTIVILGDLFHDRQNLGIDILVAVCEWLEETSARGVKVITFPGNHDMFLRHSWDVNSLIPLRKHLTVIEDVSVLKLDEQRFWVIPFITYERSYMKVLRRAERQCEPEDKLLTHIGVRGSTLNTCFLLKDWSSVNFEDTPFKRVYTGHFHSRQQVGEKVFYPGSLIPFKFDEGDVPHGFLVYDTEEDSHKFVNVWKAAEKFFPDVIPPPQFCTVMDDQLEGLTEEDLRHNIVRVAQQREYTRDEKDVIRKQLVGLGARSVRWMNFAQKLEQRREIVKSRVEGRDLFKAFTEQDATGLKNLDVRTLTQLHDEVIHDGDELYSVEESETL